MKLKILRTKFLNFCSYSKADFYNQSCNINADNNLLPAVWGISHCEFIINEKISCTKCNGQIYIDIKNNILKCLKCKNYQSIKNIERICNTCKAKYKSNILIYNPMETYQINNYINNALSLKKKSYPKEFTCCNNSNNNKFKDYFHSKNCKEKIYTFNYNNQDLIICEKCKKLYNYDNFNWICPICNNEFKENNIKSKENIIKIPNSVNNTNKAKKNYNSRIFNGLENSEKKNNNISNIKTSIKYNKNDNNEIDWNKNVKFENNSNKITLNFFNLEIKEKEKEKRVMRIIKNQANLVKNKLKENDEKIDDKKKIVNLELKTNNNENKQSNEKKRFFFRRFNNIKNKNTIKNESNEIENLDNNKISNNNLKNSEEKPIFVNKVSKLQINTNYEENIEKKKYSFWFRKKHTLNEEKNNIQKTENINKKEKEDDSKKLDNKNNQTSNFNNETKVNNSIKYNIKNYLLQRPREKYRKLQTETNKNNNHIIPSESIKDKEKIDCKDINKKIKVEEKNIISVSKKADNNVLAKIPMKFKSNYYSSSEEIKTSKNKFLKNNKNQIDINNKNNDKIYPMANSQSNNPIKSNIKNNNKYSKEPKLEEDKVMTAKKEKIKNFSLPKKLIKLNKINKPEDIIEPENIDKNKDFPIEDPYLKNNLDLYEEIQDKLKETMYKNTLPMFNQDFYKIEKKIGEGTNGIIFQVVNIKNGKRYALKKIISNDIIALKYIKKEFDLVYEADHPNILSIYGISIKCFDSNTFSLSVLMDLGITDWDIEINDRYDDYRYYTEKELMSILKQLVSGLKYLQKEKKVAHRDVKPENVIIFSNNIYKLGDFGEAKATKNSDKLSTLRGTDTYMSPILYKGLKLAKEDVIHDIYKSDVFSLGYSILYAVSLNHDILNEIRDLEKIEDIKEILYKRMLPKYSKDFINIILKMINPDERQRIDFISLDKLINTKN